jgi:hypothetical protein
MNYRSVMVFGVAHVIEDLDEKRRSIQALVDHLMPGRRAELRKSTIKELNATSLLALPIETFSSKCRTGPPEDSKSDLDAPVWAGVVPLSLTAGNYTPRLSVISGRWVVNLLPTEINPIRLLNGG